MEKRGGEIWSVVLDELRADIDRLYKIHILDLIYVQLLFSGCFLISICIPETFPRSVNIELYSRRRKYHPCFLIGRNGTCHDTCQRFYVASVFRCSRDAVVQWY